MTDVLQEAIRFISDCYGHQSEDMSTSMARSWAGKIGHARNITSKLCLFPPTTESFKKNVKRAHLQAIHWLFTSSRPPSQLDQVFLQVYHLLHQLSWI